MPPKKYIRILCTIARAVVQNVPIRNYKNVLGKSVSCLHGINKQWNHRLHEGFNAKWYARLDTYGLEICPKQYVRTEYESILKGKLTDISNTSYSPDFFFFFVVYSFNGLRCLQCLRAQIQIFTLKREKGKVRPKPSFE